jgi:hypothetical protein
MHRDPSCGEIQKHHKLHQRQISVTAATLSSVLTDFIQNEHRFQANLQENDLWLDVSLSTTKHEEAFVYVLHLVLSGNYGSFQHAQIIDYQC